MCEPRRRPRLRPAASPRTRHGARCVLRRRTRAAPQAGSRGCLPASSSSAELRPEQREDEADVPAEHDRMEPARHPVQPWSASSPPTTASRTATSRPARRDRARAAATRPRRGCVDERAHMTDSRRSGVLAQRTPRRPAPARRHRSRLGVSLVKTSSAWRRPPRGGSSRGATPLVRIRRSMSPSLGCRGLLRERPRRRRPVRAVGDHSARSSHEPARRRPNADPEVERVECAVWSLEGLHLSASHGSTGHGGRGSASASCFARSGSSPSIVSERSTIRSATSSSGRDQFSVERVDHERLDAEVDPRLDGAT